MEEKQDAAQIHKLNRKDLKAIVRCLSEKGKQAFPIRLRFDSLLAYCKIVCFDALSVGLIAILDEDGAISTPCKVTRANKNVSVQHFSFLSPSSTTDFLD